MFRGNTSLCDFSTVQTPNNTFAQTKTPTMSLRDIVLAVTYTRLKHQTVCENNPHYKVGAIVPILHRRRLRHKGYIEGEGQNQNSNTLGVAPQSAPLAIT